MYKLALLALVLVFANANVNHHAKFVDTKTVLAEIDAEPFGNVILSAVQAHLQAKTPADEVNILLNSIVTGIIQDQRDHDAVNRTDLAACERILFDLDTNINYHIAEQGANTELRDNTIAALADAEADLRQTIKDIEANEALYAREEATRNAQHDTWVRKDGEHDDALAAVDDGIKLIQHLQLGASFAQLKSRYDAVLIKLKENTSHEALLKPIIAALTELNTNVNFKAIQQIAQLLAELRQHLVGAKNNLRDTEEKQAANWVQFSAHLTNEHNRLVERKQQLEGTITQCHSTIETAIEFLEYHTLEREVNEEGLARQQAWCELQSYVYETQSQERARQQEVILRIQEHLVEKLSPTAQFIAGRRVQ